MKTKYTPAPISTDDIVLTKDLEELMEQIAENVHDVWAVGRFKNGWKYGERRDDIRKLHPCLVPYNELSEEEKDFDRNTARETLKLIQKLGFQIEHV